MPKVEYSEVFERFWAAYPARPGNPKAAAFTLFLRLSRGGRVVTEEELVQAAGNYAAECRRRKLDPLYIPHARTWLQQSRWADHLTGEEARTASGVIAVDPRHPLAALGRDLSEAAWRSWIKPLVIEQGPDGPIVRAPSPFFAERVRAQYLASIRRVLGAGVEVLP